MPGGGGDTKESTFIPNVTFILKRRRRGYRIPGSGDTQNNRAGIHTMAEHIEYGGIQDTGGGIHRIPGGDTGYGGCT